MSFTPSSSILRSGPAANWWAEDSKSASAVRQAYPVPRRGVGCACGNQGMGFVQFAVMAAAQVGPLIAKGIQALFDMGRNPYNVAATQVVNQAEIVLQQNLANWNSSPKNCVDWATALNVFDTVWGQVASICTAIAGNPTGGGDARGAGTRCVQDRQPGGKFDWYAAYRTPIQQDSAVSGVCDPLTGQQIYGTAVNPSAPAAGGTSPTTTQSSPSTTSPSDVLGQLFNFASTPLIAGIPMWAIGGAALLMIFALPSHHGRSS